MTNLGDINLGDTIDHKFTTVSTTGVPTTLAGTPVVSAYVGNSITEITAGITLTVDFDGRTGMHNLRVVVTGGNGFAAGTDVQLVITTGTVGGTSVVGYVIGQFSIEKRSALRPTTAGRTLNVTTGFVDRVTLVDTVTAYTGNTPQTGDNYARIGVAGVGLTNLGDARLANLVGHVPQTGDSYARIGAAGAGLTAVDDAVLAGIAALVIPSLAAIAAQITSDHGSGLYTRNTEPPTAAAVASQVRTELTTELGRVDATISSRASQTSVDDVPTNAELATALAAADDAVLAAVATRASQTSVDDVPTNAELATALGTADDAVLAAIADLESGGGGPTAAEIATQVRTELATELARVDATISSRGSQTSVDAIPTNAELATALAGLSLPSLAAIAAQMTSDHGAGSYVRNTEPDNTSSVAAATTAAQIASFLTEALTESYSVKGEAPTLTELLFEVRQRFLEFVITDLVISVKNMAGTEAFTLAIDHPTRPTSSERAT